MSLSRRERRKLFRDLKKNGQDLDGIVTPEMGEEIRRRHLQKIKNESVADDVDQTETDSYDPSGQTSYDSFKSLIVNRDWSKY